MINFFCPLLNLCQCLVFTAFHSRSLTDQLHVAWKVIFIHIFWNYLLLVSCDIYTTSTGISVKQSLSINFLVWSAPWVSHLPTKNNVFFLWRKFFQSIHSLNLCLITLLQTFYIFNIVKGMRYELLTSHIIETWVSNGNCVLPSVASSNLPVRISRGVSLSHTNT